MIDSTTNGSATAAPATLAGNEHVKELLGVLKDNGRDTSGLTALLNHVADMESFIKNAESKISDMKSQLDTMKEIQGHPLRNALQGAINALERKVAEIKNQLAEIKSNIINGCKNTVIAFKEKGAAALDKLASFLNIRVKLQSVRKNIDESVKLDNKAIAKIETFSKEYHQTGKHLRNLMNVLTGKPLINAVKESGKLAKAISAPYRAHKAVQLKLKAAVISVIGKLERLEQRTAAKHEVHPADKAASATEKRPPLIVRIKINKERIKQLDLEKAIPGRVKAKGLEL